MKKLLKPSSFLLITAVFALYACQIGGVQTANLVVSISTSSSSARTIYSEGSKMIAGYTLTLTSGETAVTDTSSSTATISLNDLIPGSYTLNVEAFNASSFVVARASQAVTLSAGSNTLTVALSWVTSGYGSISYSISWPSSIEVSSVGLSYGPMGESLGDESSLSIARGTTMDSVNLTLTDISSGDEHLLFKLYSEGSSVPIASVNEVAQVLAGITSRGSCELSVRDFSKAPESPNGGLSAEVVDAGVELTWVWSSGQINRATGFIIQRKLSTDTDYVTVTVLSDGTLTVWIDTGAVAGSYYDYRIAGTNAFGSGSWLDLADPVLNSIPVSSILLSASRLTINCMDDTTKDLSAAVSPSNATDKSLTWTSSNTGVAIVNSSGLVTGKASGVSTITVATTDGLLTDSCVVTVYKTKSTVFSLNNGDINMVYVPAKTFPVNTDDSGTATVNKSFWMQDIWLSSVLGYEVYTWALDHGYEFYNGFTTPTGTDPFDPANAAISGTAVDELLLCNAFTEYYNELHGTTLSCAYFIDDDYLTPARVAKSVPIPLYIKGAIAGNTSLLNSTATGFRLPMEYEYRLAARFIADKNGDDDICDEGEFYPGWTLYSGSDTYTNGTTGITVGTSDIDGDGDFQDYIAYTDSTRSKQLENDDHHYNCNALGIYWIGAYYELSYDFASNATISGWGYTPGLCVGYNSVHTVCGYCIRLVAYLDD